MTVGKYIEEQTKIEVPHLDGTLIVAHPFYGPDTTLNLRDRIRADGLREPTSGEVTSFVHASYKQEGPIFEEATRIMDESYFRAFTGISYDKERRLVFFVDSPEFDEEGNIILNRDEIVKRHDSGDETLRSVPFEHIVYGREMGRDLDRDLYAISWVGNDLETLKLFDIAQRTESGLARLHVPDVTRIRDLTRVRGRKPRLKLHPSKAIAALSAAYFGCKGVWLDIDGRFDGKDWDGYAFGVSEK